MKNFILKISLLLTLIIAANCAIYSQTPTSPIVGKAETVSFLIRQNENARSLISAQDKRIGDLENELVVERENSSSLGKSYESAKTEIALLKQSNEALSRAVALNESTIAVLRDDNQKQRDRAKRASRDKWKAIAAAAASILLSSAF